ncbi:MAG: DHH family phosphoesterase [Lentimicrobiaceae bacterium]|nr:DHH family phosphoesterase [Lentimicrobiaceae bacterium]
MNLKQTDILQIAEMLTVPKKVAVAVHYNPDGDAIGAALALSLFLQAKGHEVSILSPNELPDFLEWMPQADRIFVATQQFEICKEKIAAADVIFCLDFNAFDRVGVLQEALEQAKSLKILIDHHINPSPVFDIAYSVVEKTSSTCELMYRFLAHILKEKTQITKQMAECMYVGIMIDTGSLSYSCNNQSTYRVLGELFRLGIDGEKIHQLVYDNYSENRIKLLGFCLSERLFVLPDCASSYIYLTKEDLARFNYKQGDTEGIVNYGMSIKGIRFTALFTERDDRIRLSFRSKGDFDVNRFARLHFSGGGHKNASGGNSYQTMENTITDFLSLVEKYKTELTTPWD